MAHKPPFYSHISIEKQIFIYTLDKNHLNPSHFSLLIIKLNPDRLIERQHTSCNKSRNKIIIIIITIRTMTQPQQPANVYDYTEHHHKFIWRKFDYCLPVCLCKIKCETLSISFLASVQNVCQCKCFHTQSRWKIISFTFCFAMLFAAVVLVNNAAHKHEHAEKEQNKCEMQMNSFIQKHVYV